MRRVLIALMLLIGIASAVGWTDYETCEPIGASSYKCLAPTLVEGVPITFVDDLTCYSSMNTTCETDCEGIVDVGCFSLVQPDHDLTFTLNYDIIDNTTGEKLSSTTETLSVPRLEEDAYEVMVDPEVVDFSGCTKSFERGFYAIACQYNGKQITFDGGVITGGGDTIFVVIEATEAVGFDIGSFLSENWLYLILGLILIIIIVWASKPRKEKPVGMEPAAIAPPKPKRARPQHVKRRPRRRRRR